MIPLVYNYFMIPLVDNLDWYYFSLVDNLQFFTGGQLVFELCVRESFLPFNSFNFTS